MVVQQLADYIVRVIGNNDKPEICAIRCTYRNKNRRKTIIRHGSESTFTENIIRGKFLLHY